jgi:L,D-peptidoglycan transpeptidase YkuD (ErfK/YbiS/YcfS/YnhG family)
MNLIVTSTGGHSALLDWGHGARRAATGHSGIGDKRAEGDGVTPIGMYPLRRLLYRLDRVGVPHTRLVSAPIAPDDGWCDAPGDPQYNLQVKRPYRASNEELWRADHLYDLLVVIGFNDDPVVRGKGSAIFLHVARPGYGPTAGCVAIAMADWHDLLPLLAPGDTITIRV